MATIKTLLDGRELVGRRIHGMRTVTITNIVTKLNPTSIFKRIINILTGKSQIARLGSLSYQAVTENGYNLSISFSDINLSNVKGALDSVKSNQMYSWRPDTNVNPVTCRCNCPDFQYVYSPYTPIDGTPFPKYVSKGLRPSPNPGRYPGMCKHLLKLSRVLKIGRLVRDDSNILSL